MTRIIAPVLLSSLAGIAVAQTKHGNHAAITPDRLQAHLELIASDELEGRDTPSRGLDTACKYVVSQLKLWGATPAGDNGTFFQKIKLSRSKSEPDQSTLEFAGKSYKYGEGIFRVGSGGDVDGKLVYVGHGYMIKSKGIDPYKGLDLKGKVLVTAMGMPEGVSFRDFQGSSGTDFLTPAAAAEKYGAKGIVTIADSGYASSWSPSTRQNMGGFSPESDEDGDGQAGVPTVTVSPDVARAMFDGERVPVDDVLKGRAAPEAGFDLSGKSIKFKVTETKETAWTQNVVAVIPGTDPKLKSEYVAFGAHIDHVGMRTSGTGDRIFNGADDDGSGTVSILEIAHAFLTGAKPKRSLLFVWHCGEEKGLWGSSYYVEHPTVDLKNVVAQLNIDMIGRSKAAGDTNAANKVLTGPDEIYVVGSTKMSTDLQKASESVNADFLKLKFNYKYDDPADQERIFYRSDHYNYARKGVPIIFYFDGVHEDYHRVSDQVEKIDFQKMSKVARTVYATGWDLANAARRPVVDKPLKD